MGWVFVDQKSVVAFANSKSLREAARALLLSQAPTNLPEREALCCLPLGGGCKMLVAWGSDTDDKERQASQEFQLCISSQDDSSNLFALPDEEITAAFDRICHLSLRIWGDIQFSQHWSAKKLADCQTIFLSSQLLDVRVAFSSSNIYGINCVRIGAVFSAYCADSKIWISELYKQDLQRIPPKVSRPINTKIAKNDAIEPTVNNEDTDFTIDRNRSEGRHLFSMVRSDWMSNDSPLTSQQRRIIHEKKCPLRIHGPGGSGKTLVLILKMLQSLEDAIVEGKSWKILFVLHNNEVRNNVRAAIEAIDERGLLATSKTDLQYLDVETLHGWCMRELKIDTGGLDYALHADIITSKRRQDEILVEVLRKAIDDRLPRMGALLSSDLRAHFTGPRDRLVANLRYEIAVRIKGRGMRNEQRLYVDSPLKSFIGSNENAQDRYFLFKIAEEYESELQLVGRLDTDDVVLSMQSRLSAPLWNRQRLTAGYDLVFVDETHLFNENERRVLPFLTRSVQEFVPIIMAFDEAQSIGGRRSGDLEKIGITKSEKRNLGYVHRSSPDIFRLARDLVERSSLMFTEFSSSEAIARMSERDRKKCVSPSVAFASDALAASHFAAKLAIKFRSKNFLRVGVIAFDPSFLIEMQETFRREGGDSHTLSERGDSIAGNPYPGIFLMMAENCGGLEFDCVIIIGIDRGRVPPSLHNISPEGHLSIREEACKELYTAITRARYHVCFVCDRRQGPSEFIEPWISSGLVKELI